MIQPAVSRHGQGGTFPLQPTRRVCEGTVLFSKARARQTVHGRLNLLHFIGGDPGRPPKFACFVGIDFADDQPVRFLQGIDVFLRIRTDGHAVHAKGEHAFDDAVVHIVPELHPRVVAVYLGQIVERPVVLFCGGVSVHSLEEAHGEFRRVTPVVERVPLRRLGRLRSDSLQPACKISVRRDWHFQITGKVVENSGHVRCALNVGMAAQSIHAAACPANVAHQQLQHGCRADRLGSRRMLGPAHGVDDGCRFPDVTVLAYGGEQISRLQKLLPWNAGNALDHLGCVAGVVLLQQLIHTIGILQSEVVFDSFGHGRQRRGRGRLARFSCRRWTRRRQCSSVVPG